MAMPVAVIMAAIVPVVMSMVMFVLVVGMLAVMLVLTMGVTAVMLVLIFRVHRVAVPSVLERLHAPQRREKNARP